MKLKLQTLGRSDGFNKMLSSLISILVGLLVGCLVSFLVSLLVIRGLMDYVRNHSFSVFGVYRIVLGVVVLVWFALAK